MDTSVYVSALYGCLWTQTTKVKCLCLCVTARLKFTVVSEPMDDDEECVDVGHAFLDLQELLLTGNDVIDQQIDSRCCICVTLFELKIPRLIKQIQSKLLINSCNHQGGGDLCKDFLQFHCTSSDSGSVGCFLYPFLDNMRETYDFSHSLSAPMSPVSSSTECG